MILGKSTRGEASGYASSINHTLMNETQGVTRKGVRQRKLELTLIVFMADEIRSISTTTRRLGW